MKADAVGGGSRLGLRLPLREQLNGYSRDDLRSDLAAGLTVGVMLIPQGMAYALIAGMPPIYGLYASLAPLAVYALLGTSRQLAVGPVAIVSLLVAAGVAPLAQGDPERYIQLALLLALMVGGIQLLMGVFRFGFLTNFLSHPVLAGFTSAAAIVIGMSQLRHLLGMNLPGSHHVHEVLGAVAAGIGDIRPVTLAIGVAAIGILWGLRRWNPAFPGALLAVAGFTLLAWAGGLEERGVAVVGSVPGGLPTPSLPALDPSAMLELLPVALTIAVVGFMESIAVAKIYATRRRYTVNPDRELVALGAANLVGAFFRAFPTTGGFSRTAVNDQAGARTTLASLFSAVVIAVTLLFLTGLFHHLPNAVLAAVVMVAVAGLVDWREAVHLWHTDRRDLAMMAVTFLATLALGIEAGILAGVLVSLVALLYGLSRPHAAILGRLPGTDSFRNLARHPEAEVVEGVTVFRIDATLCFANAEFLREQVRWLVERDPAPRALVLDFHAVNGADSTALHLLSQLLDYLKEREVSLWFAGVKGPVMDRFKRVGLDRRTGRDRYYLEVDQAVRAAEKHSRREGGGLESPSVRLNR
ncbi:MAG: solute carrier family 26 protein [Gemmatimonadota bacterium]